MAGRVAQRPAGTMLLTGVAIRRASQHLIKGVCHEPFVFVRGSLPFSKIGMALSAQTVTVYPLESYKIGQKEERPDKDATIAARFARMCVCECECVRVCVCVCVCACVRACVRASERASERACVHATVREHAQGGAVGPWVQAGSAR